MIDSKVKKTGRTGLSVENIFRCLLLKQKLDISYEQLAFHLSDSVTYRTFARLPHHLSPSRSTLQSVIRAVKPYTLEMIKNILTRQWVDQGLLNCDKVRVDSTVIHSNIAPPSDSQLLCDGIRVLSRLLKKSKGITGVSIRFNDQRKRAKSLGFRVFNAKNAEKEALYPELLQVAKLVIEQASLGLAQVTIGPQNTQSRENWRAKVQHYQNVLSQVIDQTDKRVIQKITVSGYTVRAQGKPQYTK